MTTAVAMSGGVDSAVAAALVREQGEPAFGLTMRLFGSRKGASALPVAGGRRGRCCGGDDVEVARRAAAALGLPFYVLDMEDVFRERVVEPFVAGYRAGRTPLPCADCNHHVKFDELLRRARGLGADVLATGHYARISRDTASGRVILRRGADAAKDQSYFLFGLSQEMLSCLRFPVGGLTKGRVREVARRSGLPNAGKAESQDICFIPDGDYRGFVERMAEGPEPGGEIVDTEGSLLGRHDGLSRFTVGQRRGLGLDGGRRRYVVAVEAATGRVVVGSREETLSGSLETGPVNWVSRTAPRGPLTCQVQIRHRHAPVTADIHPRDGGGVGVRFAAPVPAPAPGQAAVLYDGDVLLGGAWIASTCRAGARRGAQEAAASFF